MRYIKQSIPDRCLKIVCTGRTDLYACLYARTSDIRHFYKRSLVFLEYKICTWKVGRIGHWFDLQLFVDSIVISIIVVTITEIKLYFIRGVIYFNRFNSDRRFLSLQI